MSVLTDLRSSRDLLINLTQREIKGKYKRTILGQAWSLLNPIAQMITYSVVFSLLLKAKPDQGEPSGLDVFALWLSCGLLPWLFFNNVVTTGMASLVGNSNLIKKVYFPRESLVIANAFSWLFTFCIEMAVLDRRRPAFRWQPAALPPGDRVLHARAVRLRAGHLAHAVGRECLLP